MEDRGDKNRQRAQFSPTNLNGSGFSQPAGTHEILFDCCNPSHLLTHRGMCVSVFVFGNTVGTWPHAMTEAERRSKGKSFKVMGFFFLLTFIYIRIYKYSRKLF